MDLNTFWFILVTVLFIGFFFLEGFDYGVGILLPFIGKNDDRKAIVSTIGPFWDGNEVWLLTAGGAIFAAFPNWYATMFSGFYLPLFLILLALIVRAVAFEFRNRDERPSWRNFWDWMLFVGSALPALLWGVAITNIIEGVPIDAKMQYTGGFFNLLNPYALVGGLAFLSLFAFHGATFLTLRTEGDLLAKSKRFANLLWIPTVVFVVLFVVGGFFFSDIFSFNGVGPVLVVAAAAVTLIASGLLLRQQRNALAFAMTGLTIALATVTIFAGLYPRVMPSSTDSAYSLTVYNASSSSYTLGVMSWLAIGFVPIVLAYQIWNYWVFRKRVTSGHVHGHV